MTTYWQMQQTKTDQTFGKMTQTDTHTRKSEIQEGIEKRESVNVGGRGGFIYRVI